MSKIVAGVDIGGSHITAALIDLDTFDIIEGTFVRERVDSTAATAQIIAAWSKAIQQAFMQHQEVEKFVGIAMPGPFDYQEGISYIHNQGKYDALYGLNIKALLSAALAIPVDHISFNNDAACFLQGEIFKGELQGYAHAIGITLGTGLGSAYLTDGQSFDAALWNTAFEEGIIEDYISSRWFVKSFLERSGTAIKDVKEIVEKHPNNPATKAIFADFSANLSRFLYEFISAKKANVVIIGGNIAKAEAFFLADLSTLLNKALGTSIPLLTSILGEHAALVGAAAQFHKKVKENSVVL